MMTLEIFYKESYKDIYTLGPYVQEILKEMFEEKFKTKLYKPASRMAGVPDYECIIDNKVFYVEMKASDEGIRNSQLSWMLQHPEENIIVCYLCNMKENKRIGRPRKV